jgi:chemotaxis family two-component system sensor histidine kinase/response regulator PixL
MAISPDIRDQAYQFFIEEAPELLQVIETGLLTLTRERSTSKVHDLMRAAHSLKGGSSSVGLEAIAALAHRLENIFKILYDDQFIIDAELEDQLLQAFDCLRLPLMQQIKQGEFDPEQALATAEPIFARLEEQYGAAIAQVENYIPTSSDLGIDMVASIFEVDVAQGLAHLTEVVAHPEKFEVAGELRVQCEVFAGFAEILNLPTFGAVATAAQQALDAQPQQALEITQLAIVEFAQIRNAVLAGDRTPSWHPSPAWSTLATSATQASSLLQITSEFPPLGELIEVTATFGITSFDEQDIDTFGLDKCESPPGEDLSSSNLDFLDSYWPELVESDADNHTPHDDGSLDEMLASVLERMIDSTVDSVAIELITTTPAPPIDAIAAPSQPQSITADLVDQTSPAIPSERLPQFPTSDSQAQPHLNPSALSQPRVEPATQSEENPINPSLTIRVDSERLERMNNLVGELSINRDSLSLQNEQLQSVLQELRKRFARFQTMVSQFRELSDQTLVAPERQGYWDPPTLEMRSKGYKGDSESNHSAIASYTPGSTLPNLEFDPLEMDRYGTLHLEVQAILEELVQLEETVDDITLFARQSNQTLEKQRYMLNHLRDEVIWARMLPLGEILNRFPRILRDLSNVYSKPVNLRLSGVGVLVDRMILEKLYDPLLHLLRNAFDHGIESSHLRQQRNKPEEGQIEIRAYRKGNQTIIEVTDDGEGIDLGRVRQRGLVLGLLSADQDDVHDRDRLLDLIFEPGFSTARRVSPLSGRGIGLDVVRSQIQSIKGNIKVTTSPGQGTTFTLHLPLTLTITKLVTCIAGPIMVALPADSIEEILAPQKNQVSHTGHQRFLHVRDGIMPIHRLLDLLDYHCPLPDTFLNKTQAAVSTPKNWALPLLILRHDQQTFALEVDRLINEQELVIKPFGAAIAPPIYTYGCTILGDGNLVPVIDATALLAFHQESFRDSTPRIDEFEPFAAPLLNTPPRQPFIQISQVPTILVADDAVTIRRTLALSLERAGFRVLQARDGREALEQLQHVPSVKLIICDIEMPNMNGFEVLTHRRQDPKLSQIPIMMLTSRSNDKHRWLAMQLGASAYFTKPYLEQEFLSAVKTYF